MILVIGLDGYPWPWADRLEREGFCTNRLFSPHAQSAPAWNSLMSGLTAETHGFEGLPMRGVRDTGNRLNYVWDHLLAAGKQTICINVPFIWPPMLMRLHVAGYPAPPENYVYPKAKAARWSFRMRDLCAWHRHLAPWVYASVPDAKLLARARASRHAMNVRFREELREGQPDLALLCFTDLDRLSHAAYTTMQKPKVRWRVVDNLLAIVTKLRADYVPDWIFIVSDHGLDFTKPPPTMGPNDFDRQPHGVHLPDTRYGIFGYWSRTGAQQIDGTIQLEDLVPTLLYLLDAPPAGRLDGTALTGIIREEGVDEAATRRELERLGYL